MLFQNLINFLTPYVYYLGDLLDETEVLEWLIQQQSSIADEDVVER